MIFVYLFLTWIILLQSAHLHKMSFRLMYFFPAFYCCNNSVFSGFPFLFLSKSVGIDFQIFLFTCIGYVARFLYGLKLSIVLCYILFTVEYLLHGSWIIGICVLKAFHRPIGSLFLWPLFHRCMFFILLYLYFLW